MARTPRNYALEYARRIERQMAKGYTRAQARGHPGRAQTLISAISGRPLRGAARAAAERRAAAAPTVAVPPEGLRWSGPTSGGTQDLETTSRQVVIDALREAQGRGREVLIGVEGEFLIRSPTRRQRPDQPYAFTGRQRPEVLLHYIDDAGDVDSGIAMFLAEEQGTLTVRIDRYIVKEFAR